MSKTRKYLIVFAACMVAVSSSYAQYHLSPVAAEFMADYGFTTGQYASLMSAPLIPNIILCILAGMMIDRYGIKKILLGGTILSAAGICCRIYAGSYLLFLVCMIVAGIANAFLNASSSKLFGSYFGAAGASIAMGVLCAATQLSTAAAVGSSAMLSDYHNSFYIAALIAVLTVVVWGTFMKDPKQERTEAEKVSISACIGTVVKSRGIWLIAVVLICIMVTTVAVTSFLPMALATRGIDEVAAGGYTSLMTVGNVIGALVGPLMAVKLKNTRLVMGIFAVLAGFGVAFAWLVPGQWLMAAGLFVTGLSMGALMPLTVPLPMRLPEIGAKYAATANGFVATIEMIAASFVPSYVLVPVCGDNMRMFFGICGAFYVVAIVAIRLLPNFEGMDVK